MTIPLAPVVPRKRRGPGWWIGWLGPFAVAAGALTGYVVDPAHAVPSQAVAHGPVYIGPPLATPPPATPAKPPAPLVVAVEHPPVPTPHTTRAPDPATTSAPTPSSVTPPAPTLPPTTAAATTTVAVAATATTKPHPDPGSTP